MMLSRFRLFAVALTVPATAIAQSLERRVAAVRDGTVQFHFAARAGVCGDGKHWIRSDDRSWHGSVNDAMRAAPCETGPVRVVLIRAEGEIVRLQTYAGPLASDAAASDLGRVNSREAGAFLLGVAQRLDARPGRDGVFPASLADSTAVTPALLEIARNLERPRELRRTAISYVAQRFNEAGGVGAGQATRALAALARAEADNQQVRQQALGALMRIDVAAGFGALEQLATSAGDPWLARQATEAIARSGDPRSRSFLRRGAANGDLPSEARVAAIAGLGGEYGSAADAAFVRDLYPRLSGDRAREAALSAVASIGGSLNASWLLGIARNESEAIRQRRRAIDLADRAGAATADVVSLYDAVSDSELRGTVIEVLARDGSTRAVDKLLAIAKDDGQASHRRKAISALGRFDDARVKEALRGIVERPR
ncbi:MAG: HEAT repeat domain-containing protein [Gemmatimonadaceae bacterium]